MIYQDRHDAGEQLARALDYLEGEDAVVLALPRGGVVLGASVAKELDAPLGLVLVKKIGHPSHAEYAIGAVAEDEAAHYNENDIAVIDAQWLAHAEAEARRTIRERRQFYYGDRFTPPGVQGKLAVLVDDGIATGLTMEVAIKAARDMGARRIVVAVPIASQESIDKLEIIADEIVTLDDPHNFTGAVGDHYADFSQVDDEEVRTLLWEHKNGL